MNAQGTSPFSNIGNPWFAVSLGLVGIIIGYGIGSGLGPTVSAPAAPGAAPVVVQRPAPTPTPVPTPTPAAPQIVPVADAATADDDPFMGKEDAPVTVIEFTDYQCPFCGRHSTQTLGQIKSEYVDTGKVKYVVRDYPLSFHENAQKAAEATECADEQGKYWEMHDKLFSNQQALDIASLKKNAADLGLDTTKFNDCLDSGNLAAEVQKDFTDGSATGITGTPGFWVVGKDGKGQKLSGAQPFASFKATIDGYLN